MAKSVDWQQIEVDYRVGKLTVRQVAAKNSVSVSGLMKRAKKEAWTRDLSQAVNAAAKVKVREAVTNEWNASRTEVECSTFSAVDSAANAIAAVVMGQKGRVGAQTHLLEAMLAELALAGDIDLRTRVAMLKDAAAITTALDNEERRIHRIDDEPPPAQNHKIEALLAAMQESVVAGLGA